MGRYLRLLRVRHYVKNILVLTPLIFSGQLLAGGALLRGLLGLLGFSALSSAVYIINDIRDVAQDRAHPRKCKRPIAAGEVSVPAARWCVGVCLAAAVGITLLAGLRWWALVCMALYLALNIGYSYGLKNLPIVDIMILVSGFLLRLLYGSVITDITVSGWLYLTVMAMSFYLALGKRRNELMRLGNEQTRQVLRYYSRSFLDKNMYMFLALVNVFYALWCMDNENRAFIFTVPVVMLIGLKYSLAVEGDSDGDPVEVLLHDKVLIVLCSVYALLMVAILYIPR